MAVKRSFGVLVAAGLVMLLAVGCGDDKKESSSSTTSAGSTVGGCHIQPGASCAGDNFSNANLTGANLAGSNLATANFSGANLTNANLSGSNLTGANFTKATMVGTNLSAANLTKADFSGATLKGVNLGDATRCDTIRTDGSIDNTSCPQPGASTTAPAQPISTLAPATPLQSPCTSEVLTAALLAQGGYYGLKEEVLKEVKATGSPSCETSQATQRFSAGPYGEFTAVFGVASSGGWHLVGTKDCAPPATTVPNAPPIC